MIHSTQSSYRCFQHLIQVLGGASSDRCISTEWAPCELYVRCTLVISGRGQPEGDSGKHVRQCNVQAPSLFLQRSDPEVSPGRKCPREMSAIGRPPPGGHLVVHPTAPNGQVLPFKRVSNTYSPKQGYRKKWVRKLITKQIRSV